MITSLMTINIVGVAGGKNHAVAWDSDGRIYSWGEATKGQLGHPISQHYTFQIFIKNPRQIKVLQNE